MSLLLDALKEAEARKREAAPAMASASATSSGAGGATNAGRPFETEGALALAEDLPSEPAAAPAMVSTPPRTAPTPTPVETLLAARAARTHDGASRGPAAAASTPPLALAPGAPTRPDAPAAAARPVAPPAATPPRPRGPLPWLLALAGALALALCGAYVYDLVVNRIPPPEVTPGVEFASTAALPTPQGAVPSASPAGSSASTSSPSASSRTGSPASGLADASPTAPGATGAASPPASRRANDPAATPRRLATQDSAAPRTRRSSAEVPDREAAATLAGSRDARISISREPAPLDAAWAAQQAGDLERAEALYRRVLASEQGQVDAQLGLAVIAHARGNDAAARRGYRQVLESAPEHPRAWAGLAELAGEDDAGGIESRLRQLLANRPSGPLHFALGNVLARQQRWPDAQQEYFAAATLAPEAPDYAYNVAVALERIGKSAAAMPWYSRALQQAAAGRAVRFDAAAARARLEQLQAAPP